MIDTSKLKTRLPDSLHSKEFLDLTRECMGFDFKQDMWSGAVVCLIAQEHLLIIRRSDTMPSHRSQLGFMGGHKKEGENNPIDVARREFEEESELASNELNCLGLLPAVYTSFDQVVIPVAFEIDRAPQDFLDVIVSNGEWDDAFMVSLKDLADESSWNYAWRHSQFSDGSLLFRPLLKDCYLAKFDNQKDRQFWGATARMVWNLMRIAHKE
jgi:8-oxo-dGTP pyrophosphatase MutT (NUDIX family)